MANSVDPDQTVSSEAVYSGSTLFAYAILSDTLLYDILDINHTHFSDMNWIKVFIQHNSKKANSLPCIQNTFIRALLSFMVFCEEFFWKYVSMRSISLHLTDIMLTSDMKMGEQYITLQFRWKISLV